MWSSSCPAQGSLGGWMIAYPPEAAGAGRATSTTGTTAAPSVPSPSSPHQGHSYSGDRASSARTRSSPRTSRWSAGRPPRVQQRLLFAVVEHEQPRHCAQPRVLHPSHALLRRARLKARLGAGRDLERDLVCAREAEPERAAREVAAVPVHEFDRELRLAEAAEPGRATTWPSATVVSPPLSAAATSSSSSSRPTNSGFGASGMREPAGSGARPGTVLVGIDARSACAAASRAGASGVGPSSTSAW